MLSYPSPILTGPASSAPPAVAPTSVPGTSMQFARADHTHASSVQAVRLEVSGTTGLLTWTFPIPYDAGVTPIVAATVETSAGATLPFIVNVVGQPSNTQVTLQVFRTMATTLPVLAASLPGFVVNPFGFAPAGTLVNIIARKPS